MRKKLPQRDPIAAYGRKVTAARRVGVGAQCACGETRPEALLAGSIPTICAACDRKRRGQTASDNHHVAGKANSPVMVPVPVNDHWAILNPAQFDWPKETLQNPDSSPLRAGAACIRGCADTIVYLVKHLLLWVADMLETLDAFLVNKWGPKWWVNTELEQFKPKRKSDVAS